MKIGFIGLGNVGGKLSGSLLRNGVDLSVHDLDAALVAEMVTEGARGQDMDRDVDNGRGGDQAPWRECDRCRRSRC